MTETARIVAEIPLASGSGNRTVAVDDGGTGHLFMSFDELRSEAAPRHSFRVDEAVQLARDVLAGKERTVTASWPLHVLAAAVLLLAEGRSS